MSDFKVITKAILKKNGKFLVIKRSPDAHAFANYWDFPGGKLEEGEQPFKAVEREVFEETGLKAKAQSLASAFVLHHQGEHLVFLSFNVRPLAGKVKVSSEHTEWKWVGKKFLLTEKFLEPFIRDLVEKKVV